MASRQRKRKRGNIRKGSGRRSKKGLRFRGCLTLIVVALILFAIVRFYPEWSTLLFHRHEEGVLYVTFLDVGQGDSIFLAMNGVTMLIDAGERPNAGDIMRYIRRHGYRRIDFLIATHPHADHIGGMADIIRGMEIGDMLMPNVQHNTRAFENMLDAIIERNVSVFSPTPGDTFMLGDALVTVVAPFHYNTSNLNNVTIVLMVELGEHTFLFTGDAETELEAEIVASRFDISATVLNVGHHGSQTSTTEPFLRAVSPEIAVISVGRNNTYGHPHRAVIERLERANVRIYRTSTSGNVTISTDGAVLNVRTSRWWGELLEGLGF